MKKKIYFIIITLFYGFVFSAVATVPIPDWSVNLFYQGDGTNSSYFRIPALCTLDNGDVIAAMDGRINSAKDSPNDIDVKMKMLVQGGPTWKHINFPYNFIDHARTSDPASSASLIDPCLVQDVDRNRIYLLIDAFSWGGGLLNNNVVAGTGFKTIDGKQYLALTNNAASNANDRDIANYKYSVREDGIIWNDVTNTPTEYMINKRFEVLQKNGATYQPLTVTQVGSNPETVPMNVFYMRSSFRVLRVSYLFLFYSDDYGQTWSEPLNLNFLKKESENHFFSGCGKGLQVKKGTYKGRVLLPVYFNGGAGVIYTDDGGITWNRSAQTAGTESELVEMPEGHVGMFSRTSTGYMSVSYSYNGGVSWTPSQRTTLLNPSCKISAVGYSRTIDGKPAIFISYPNSSTSRTNGTIATGLVSITGRFGANNDPRYQIDWQTPVEIKSDGFAYSTMVEMPDSRLGLLFEDNKNWTRMEFAVYSVNQLVSGEIGSSIQNLHIKTGFRQTQESIIFENEQRSIRLYNLQGNLVKFVENTNQLDVKHIKKGVYIMQINDFSGFPYSEKVVL